MALFTAEGLTYPNAFKLMKQLNQAGIEANITAGGVAVHPTPDRVNEAKRMCTEARASFKAGYSLHQEGVLLDGGGYDHLAKVTNNARSIVQEWSE